jgi:hypothetical protein
MPYLQKPIKATNRVLSTFFFSLEALMRGMLYQQLCDLLPLSLYLNDT